MAYMKMLVSSIMNLMLQSECYTFTIYDSAGNGAEHLIIFSVMEPGMREVNIMNTTEVENIFIQITLF